MTAGGPVIAHRDSSATWQLVDSPRDPSAFVEALYDVSCAAATTCFAVGGKSETTGDDTLIQRWDGSRWSDETAGNTAAGNPALTGVLIGVDCPSTARCLAVGTRVVGDSLPQPLVEERDGSSWKPSTIGGAGAGYLSDVTCLAADDCWAVGGQEVPGLDVEKPLVAHFDGTAWTQLQIGAGANNSSESLEGVGCASASDCWAVGSQASLGTLGVLAEQQYDSFMMHWDGTSWSRVAVPGAADGNTVLYDVSCAAPDRCWAVGPTSSTASMHPFVLAWDGHSWSAAQIPFPASPLADYGAIDCLTDGGGCYAAGGYNDGSAIHMLVAHWTPSSL
jgi:hypothetical protein